MFLRSEEASPGRRAGSECPARRTLKLSEIRAEQGRLREQATVLHGRDDAERCRVELFDMLATWDESDGAQRTKLLASLFERIEAHVAVPERGTKFRTKRQADAVARLLADHGHEIEWVRKNCGAQRKSTWNVRLADLSEVHIAGHLEDRGLALPREAWPAVGRVKVRAVPKEGWRRFFEYVPLERETGFVPATSTLASRRSAPLQGSPLGRLATSIALPAAGPSGRWQPLHGHVNSARIHPLPTDG